MFVIYLNLIEERLFFLLFVEMMVVCFTLIDFCCSLA